MYGRVVNYLEEYWILFENQFVFIRAISLSFMLLIVFMALMRIKANIDIYEPSK